MGDLTVDPTVCEMRRRRSDRTRSEGISVYKIIGSFGGAWANCELKTIRKDLYNLNSGLFDILT